MHEKSLNDVRDKFRARTQLFEGEKGNFKNRYKDSSRRCQGCKSIEDNKLHVLVCEAFGPVGR